MKSSVLKTHPSLNRLCHNPVALFSALMISLYLALALFSALGWIATDFQTIANDRSYQPPSWEYWFGTDLFGRNVLSRAIHATQTALLVGLFSTTLATVLGLFFGSLAGYFGGRTDDLVVWLYTTIDSIPYILLVSAFAFMLGQGILNLLIALGLTSWIQLCRLVRSEFMKHKAQDYVQAAKALGAGSRRQIFRHILPNVFHIALIQFSLIFVNAIKIEVILSYLGLGVEPGTPSWGMMIDDAKLELHQGVWWNLGAATFFMFFLILSVNLLNDSLRDALDPKWHRPTSSKN
ncbi:MAG: ABC transporter permease [Bdellovibrionales bacterium]|nr:ABC transporter permease [Bdellovibrionales bacterium]